MDQAVQSRAIHDLRDKGLGPSQIAQRMKLPVQIVDRVLGARAVADLDEPRPVALIRPQPAAPGLAPPPTDEQLVHRFLTSEHPAVVRAARALLAAIEKAEATAKAKAEKAAARDIERAAEAAAREEVLRLQAALDEARKKLGRKKRKPPTPEQLEQMRERAAAMRERKAAKRAAS